jgi:hypothetical protein
MFLYEFYKSSVSVVNIQLQCNHKIRDESSVMKTYESLHLYSLIWQVYQDLI